MGTDQEKPYLSDVIKNYETEIEVHNLIRLYAGVGAGKNTWTKKLAEEGYNILLITSRAVTADTQSKKLDAYRKIILRKLCDSGDAWGEDDVIQRRVVCTNADIEWFVKELYKADDSKTYIWNLFNYIFLDEAHSLTSDASFAESPFYVEMFLKYAHQQNPKCKIILMSGTQAPIDWLFESENDRKVVHNIDLFDQCRHVDPEHVRLMTTDFAMNHIIKFLKEGKRIIYFANSIKRIKSCVEELHENGVSEEDIGISYSADERDKDFSDELVAKKKFIYDSLVQEEHLPDNVKIFLTTIKNKEGININDEDIKIMFAESHNRDELVQMAGRVRKGLKDLCVLYDANEHSTNSNEFGDLLNKNCLKMVQNTVSQYEDICAERGQPFSLEKTVKTVEEIFGAIRYNPLKERFALYRGRIESAKQHRKDSRELQRCVEDWNIPDSVCGMSGFECFQKWFPYSEIKCYVPKYQSQEAIIRMVQKYLKDKGYTPGVVLDKTKRDALIGELNKCLKECNRKMIPCSYPIKNLNAALKHFGFSLTGIGRHGTEWKIEEHSKKK